MAEAKAIQLRMVDQVGREREPQYFLVPEGAVIYTSWQEGGAGMGKKSTVQRDFRAIDFISPLTGKQETGEQVGVRDGGLRTYVAQEKTELYYPLNESELNKGDHFLAFPDNLKKLKLRVPKDKLSVT